MKKDKHSKYGFPNIVRKRNLISMQEIFNDVNVKSKLFVSKPEDETQIKINKDSESDPENKN